ncbi:MAG TPA: flavodoxin domain-containing protein [Methanocella sp.]|nr:flavodoxin domain-containing protein [Methanocella sp.]
MAGKRALIVYDSKYGATEQIANWIAEGINDADLSRVDRVNGLAYDLIVVGCPVYYEAPSPRIIRFLDRNRDALKNRKLALFTVSVPLGMTPERAPKFTGQKDVKALFDHVAGTVISSKAFLGRIELKEMSQFDRLSIRMWCLLKGCELKDASFLNRDEAVAWGKRLLELLIRPPDVIPPQPKGSSDVPPRPGGSGGQTEKS